MQLLVIHTTVHTRAGWGPQHLEPIYFKDSTSMNQCNWNNDIGIFSCFFYLTWKCDEMLEDQNHLIANRRSQWILDTHLSLFQAVFIKSSKYREVKRSISKLTFWSISYNRHYILIYIHIYTHIYLHLSMHWLGCMNWVSIISL